MYEGNRSDAIFNDEGIEGGGGYRGVGSSGR